MASVYEITSLHSNSRKHTAIGSGNKSHNITIGWLVTSGSVRPGHHVFLMRQKRAAQDAIMIEYWQLNLPYILWFDLSFLSAKRRTKKENAMAGLKITNASTTCLSRKICWIRQFAKLYVKTIWKWLMHCKTRRHYDERQDLLQRKGSSCEPFAVKGHLWLYDLPNEDERTLLTSFNRS